MKKLIAAIIISISLGACSVSEWSYIAGVTGAYFDYQLHDNGTR